MIAVAMTSRRYNGPTTGDIRFSEGDAGIWLLEYQEGALRATHPQDFQNLDLREEILRLIAGQG